MSENRYSEAEWQVLDDEIQNRFQTLADAIHAAAPSVKPRFGKTVTDLFPLFTYVSFKRPRSEDGEYIIVGVDIAFENAQWRVHADISDEEEGTIYFELPRTPFSASSFEELKDRVSAIVEQLIQGGTPVLLRLFGTPASVPTSSAVNVPEVARKS